MPREDIPDTELDESPLIESEHEEEEYIPTEILEKHSKASLPRKQNPPPNMVKKGKEIPNTTNPAMLPPRIHRAPMQSSPNDVKEQAKDKSPVDNQQKEDEKQEEGTSIEVVQELAKWLNHILNQTFESLENNRSYAEFLPSIWQSTQGQTSSFLSLPGDDMAKIFQDELKFVLDSADRLTRLLNLLVRNKTTDRDFLIMSIRCCQCVESYIASCMQQQGQQGNQPAILIPGLDQLQQSNIRVRFPRYFVPVMHHCMETANHPCQSNDDGHSVHLLPTMYHLWSNIVDKTHQEYKVPVSCGDMHTLLFHMKKCDEQPMDPMELLQLYMKEWMSTYLKPDQAKIPEDVFKQISAEPQDSDDDEAGSKTFRQGYIVLHGGYLLRICRTIVTHDRTKKPQPGLSFIIRLFH